MYRYYGTTFCEGNSSSYIIFWARNEYRLKLRREAAVEGSERFGASCGSYEL